MSLYKPEYCEQLLTHCDSGRSLESFCALIRVSPKVISEWYNDFTDFKEAVDMAPCLELLYWEMTMVRALQNRDKDSINVAKSKLDHLAKYIVSPLKKSTYGDLKENNINKSVKSTGDLVKDLDLLYGEADS
jgi:hypothetical protein